MKLWDIILYDAGSIPEQYNKTKAPVALIRATGTFLLVGIAGFEPAE